MYNYKSILRSAASRTREVLPAEEFNSSSHDCILTTCSRAVFADNVNLASHLIRRYRIAREHLYISNNSVHMHSAERLSLEISRARHRALENRVRDTESQARTFRPNSSKFNSCQNKIRFLSNIMRQWIPFGKFLTISAIANDAGQIIAENASEIMTSLAKHWAPFLDGSSDNFHPEVAHAAFDALPNGGKWDWSKVRLPNTSNFVKILEEVPDSSPGFDGLPYSAHRSRSEISAVLLEEEFRLLRRFNPDEPPPSSSLTTSSNVVSLRRILLFIIVVSLAWLKAHAPCHARTQIIELFAKLLPTRSCLL